MCVFFPSEQMLADEITSFTNMDNNSFSSTFCLLQPSPHYCSFFFFACCLPTAVRTECGMGRVGGERHLWSRPALFGLHCLGFIVLMDVDNHNRRRVGESQSSRERGKGEEDFRTAFVFWKKKKKKSIKLVVWMFYEPVSGWMGWQGLEGLSWSKRHIWGFSNSASAFHSPLVSGPHDILRFILLTSFGKPLYYSFCPVFHSDH